MPDVQADPADTPMPFQIQSEDDRFRLDAAEAQIAGAGQPLRRVAVQPHLGDRARTSSQSRSRSALRRTPSAVISRPRISTAAPRLDDASPRSPCRRGGSARARHRAGRRPSWSPADVEPAHAAWGRRSCGPRRTGGRSRRRPRRWEPCRRSAPHPRGAGPPLAGDAPDLAHGLDGARLGVRVHQRDEDGVRPMARRTSSGSTIP